MTIDYVSYIGSWALIVTLLVAAPMLGFGLLVGVVISILQAVTQIQEMTLTFIPKIIAIMVSIVIFGRWMLSTLIEFTSWLFMNIPEIVRSAG